MNATEKSIVLAELGQMEAAWKRDRLEVAIYTARLLKETNLTGEEIAGALETNRPQVYRRIAEAGAFLTMTMLDGAGS